jgi:hypothetical protein
LERISMFFKVDSSALIPSMIARRKGRVIHTPAHIMTLYLFVWRQTRT